MKLQQYLDEDVDLGYGYNTEWRTVDENGDPLFSHNHPMVEAVIFVSVHQYEKGFRDIKNMFKHTDISTIELVQQFNYEFNMDRYNGGYNVRFVVVSKKSNTGVVGGETNKRGGITIFLSNNISDVFMNQFEMFLGKMLNTLYHELVHREQSRKVDIKFFDNKNTSKIPKTGDEDDMRKYLSHTHEVMAYAISIVDLLVKKYHHPKTVIEFLQKPKIGVSTQLDRYLKNFDIDSKTMKLLYKYMYEYIIKGMG